MQAWIGDPNKIQKCLTLGRMLLIPKTEDLSSEKDYRPITYTSCKIFTGILAQHVKKHVVQIDLCDKSLMGTCEKALSTVDQLLIDNAVMGEVIDHHHSLAVAYYTTKKDTTWFIMIGC